MKHIRTVLASLATLAILGLVACPNEADPGNSGTTPTTKPAPNNPWPDEWVTITNDSFWHDTDGKPIYSQSGGMYDFVDPETGNYKHYWYGIRYGGAEEYYNDPTKTASTDHNDFVAITLYSSMDLANWKFEGNMIERKDVGKDYIGRMGVAYLGEIGKYAMVLQYHERNNVKIDEILIMMSDSPTGPFTQHRIIDLPGEVGGIYTGDQTVFGDDDGTFYLIASKEDRREIGYILQIAWDAEKEEVYFANPRNPDNPRDFTELPLVYKDVEVEGNCMFRYEGKYYNTGSHLHGWNASAAQYQVTDGNIVSSYRPSQTSTYNMLNSEKDYSHVSQAGFYYVLKGTKQTTVIFAGDRWANMCDNGTGYNQWVPLTINGEVITFNSLSQWMLNPKTGEWKVAEGNNYVLNGAFEADRVVVPNVVGWKYDGTAITNQASSISKAGGKYHMAFTQATGPFTAGVSQEIELPNGVYTLRGKVRASAGFSDATLAQLYAGGTPVDLKSTGTDWADVVSEDVTVVNGRITVGVKVEGVPGGQWLNIDDITLVLASYKEP